MEAISFIVIILLSMMGYSAGAVSRAKKVVQLKPQIIDLVLIAVIWAGAIYSRVALDLNKWLLILAWLILSYLIGILAIWPRKLTEEMASSKGSQEASKSFFKRLWRSWGHFSRRMSNFQSRVVISLFFFIAFSPLALLMKALSDPLKVKHQGGESHWLTRQETGTDLEQFRRQF